MSSCPLVKAGMFFLFRMGMNYKEQMRKWLAAHPDATTEEAWEAGYMTSTDNWCHGKVEMMEKCAEMLKQIIDKV